MNMHRRRPTSRGVYLLEVAKRSLWLEELRETVQTPRPCCAKREASRLMIEMLIFWSGLGSR